MGSKWHVRDIPKGKVGEFSKIQEEFTEALDAYEQDNPVMLMVELSDMVGAMIHFLRRHYPGVTVEDLCTQAHKTNAVRNKG